MEKHPIHPLEISSLPKVELHRHLEGSLRLQTLAELTRAGVVDLPQGANLSAMVQMQANDAFTFQNFLSKFQILRQFYASKEIIERVAYEAVEDAAADQVIYMELMFTPVALSRVHGFGMADVMDWVCGAVRKASFDFGLPVRLIASVNRNESADLAREVEALAAERIAQGVVGMNLAGNEAEYSAVPFYDVFDQAHADGLAITIHAGEWNGAQNVGEAIQHLHAARIGHGVRVMEDESVVELARQRQIPFEICLTSNLQTGVIPSLESHPVNRMLEAGLRVVLATDDPSISGITLSDEYRLAVGQFGWTFSRLKQVVMDSAEASFLPEEEKNRLKYRIEQEFIKREA